MCCFQPAYQTMWEIGGSLLHGLMLKFWLVTFPVSPSASRAISCSHMAESASIAESLRRPYKRKRSS